MGYRSDVTLSLTLEALAKLPELQEAVSAYLLNKDLKLVMYEELLNFADHVDESISPEGVPFVTIGWSYIKWYDDYPVIAGINGLIAELKETSPKSYHFICMGEDFNDITIEGELDDDLYVSRVIKRGES